MNDNLMKTTRVYVEHLLSVAAILFTLTCAGYFALASPSSAAEKYKWSDEKRAKAAVTIYTLDTCPYCHQAKEFLLQKGIRFKEIDIREDPERAEEMFRISGQRGVPVIMIGNDVIVGFDRRMLEEKLQSSGL
jgi:glutaredoxin 3